MEDKQTADPQNQDTSEPSVSSEVQPDAEATPSASEGKDAGAESESQDEGAGGGEDAALEKRISEMEDELAEMKNRYLRAQADLENFRRRVRREKAEQAKYRALPVIKAMLPVLDNLERAIAASRDVPSSDGLRQGVEMVNRQIIEVLKEEGLKEIAAVNEPFNPEYHEAVGQVENDEYESGIVVEQLQKGYMLHDRVIRPAMVTVSQ